MKHRVVSHDEWIAARKDFLAKEKEFTRLRDDLSKQRRELPWERVEKEYTFEGPKGKETLSDLFDGRSQLIVYHFMFGPDWDAGCPSCSFWAESFDLNIIHLAHRDITFVAVSRAPFSKIDAYRKRMGWTFKWLSSSGSDFNFDFGVSFTDKQLAKGKVFYNYTMQETPVEEREGTSVFYKEKKGDVFHTYSAYARGIDLLNAAYNYMDLTPKGRDEGDSPMHWLHRHDEYKTAK